MSSISRPARLGPFLRSPGIAAFFVGRFLAAMGAWSERIAIGWLVWDQTDSPSLLGAAVLLRLAPAIILSPVGGVLADRRGAVGILRLTQAINVALALVLVFFAGALPLWALMAFGLALGGVQALAAAPLKSVVPQVMDRADLPMAIPLSSATFNLAAFVGPAVAGTTIALYGASAAFATSVLGCLAFFLALRRWVDTDATGSNHSSGFLREMGAAARYSRDDRILWPVFGLHLAAALCLRPFIDLLPAYIGASGDRGAAMLGLATSAVGAGAVLGAAWMAVSAAAGSLARRLLGGTSIAILSLVWLAWVGFSASALPVVLLFGSAMVVRATSTLTIIQLEVEPSMRGRVAGLYSMTIRGGSAAGAAAIGAVAEHLGMRPALAVGACACAVTLGLQWRHIMRSKGSDADAPENGGDL